MSLPRLIHSTIFSKMSVGYALKRNRCPFLDCSSMVFYRAIPSIFIYIYVYSTRSFYRSLASNSLRISWAWGMFGENLTIEGLLDESVHIGDRFEVGSAHLMVTQPRLPCYKLGLKF